MTQKPLQVGTSLDMRLMHYSVGALIEDHGEYLFFDRKYEPLGFAGMAGHIDRGEDHLTALLREGREELGVDLGNPQLLYEQEIPWNHCYRAPVHYWYLYRATVRRDAVQINPEEAGRGGWFTPAQLRTMALEPVWKHWLTLGKVL